MDIVGPLPQCKNYRYVLTCIDRFTRWTEAIPLEDITAESVANAFLNGWISRYGVPAQVITDQGKQFESRLFKELAKMFGIRINHTTPYHPQANGLVERWHRSLKAALKCYEKREWIDNLPIILMSLHSTVIQDIGYSPAEMMFGINLRLPGQLFERDDKFSCDNDWIKQFVAKMQTVVAPPALRHCKNIFFVPDSLRKCTHVFVRHDAVRKPLQRP